MSTEWARVGGPDALGADGERLHVEVAGRYVSIIRHRGKLHCLDSTCYHTGGPLGNGDIEDVQGHTCIVCPWHMYQITLDEGAKLYESLVMGPNGKLVPGGWKKKDHAQRVHAVERRDDGIFVKLNLDGKWDSDAYGNSACGLKLQQQQQQPKVDHGHRPGEVRLHSRAPFAPQQHQQHQHQQRNAALPRRSGHVLNPGAATGRGASAFGAASFEAPFDASGPGAASSLLRNLTSSSAAGQPLVEGGDDAEDEDASEWVPMQVAMTAADGVAGVKLALLPVRDGNPAPEAVREQLKRLYGIDEDFGDGSVLDTEDLFNTAHVRLALVLGDEVVERPFTPVHSPHRLVAVLEEGGADAKSVPPFEFAIRVYPKGALTPHLAALSPGARVQVAPGLRAQGPDLASCALPPLGQLEMLFLFAGGSGITPLLQVLENAMDRPTATSPTLRIVFVCANQSFKRSLALDMLSGLSRKITRTCAAHTQLDVVHLFGDTDGVALPASQRVEKATRVDDPAFLASIGVRESGAGQAFASCGPPGFMTAVKEGLCGSMAVPASSIVEFAG